MSEKGFGGRRVVSFESRRAAEMASLIERYGGVPVKAPTMREVAITENEAARAFARELAAGGFGIVVLMTGVGVRALLEEISPEIGREDFVRSLGLARVIARGPKPAVVLKEIGLTDYRVVPEPNTWREVVDVIAGLGPLAGRRIAVQEHGTPSRELYAALEEQGARVTPVPVYRWALPEDTGPLRRALHAVAAGEVSIALFTSRAQVENAFTIAAEEGIADQVRQRLAAGFIASIGPVCSEALRAEGLSPNLEPGHPKMGHLVKEAAAAL